MTKKLADAIERRKKSGIQKEESANGNLLLEKAINRFSIEKLEEWKKMHSGRQLIILAVEEKMAVLRPVGVNEMSEYITTTVTTNTSVATTQLVNSLWLDGDNELLEDDDLFLAVYTQVAQILEARKADFFRY